MKNFKILTLFILTISVSAKDKKHGKRGLFDGDHGSLNDEQGTNSNIGFGFNYGHGLNYEGFSGDHSGFTSGYNGYGSGVGGYSVGAGFKNNFGALGLESASLPSSEGFERYFGGNIFENDGGLSSFHVNTISKPVPVPFPYPIPVPVIRPYPVPVPQPVAVDIPRPVAVPVPQPYTVTNHRPYPVQINKPYLVRVPHAFPVPFPQPVPVSDPQPHSLTVPKPISVTSNQSDAFKQQLPVSASESSFKDSRFGDDGSSGTAITQSQLGMSGTNFGYPESSFGRGLLSKNVDTRSGSSYIINILGSQSQNSSGSDPSRSSSTNGELDGTGYKS